MKHNIYLLKSFGPDNQVLYKIGYSADIEKRFTQYFSHNPFIQLVNTWYVSEGINFERALHSLIKSQIRREWYTEDEVNQLIPYIESGQLPDNTESLSFKDLVKYFRDNHKEDGFTWSVFKGDYSEWIEVIEKYYEVFGKYPYDYFTVIKRQLEDEMKVDLSVEVKSFFVINRRYLRKEVKAFFNSLYATHGINKKANYSDIYQYYKNIRELSIRSDRYVMILGD